MATSEPRRVSTQSNAPATRTERGVSGVKATFTARDLSIYPSRLSSEDDRRLAPKYTLPEDEYNRLVLNFNSRKGWAYSDAEVLRMARDYVYGDERTRRIIYDRLEDANFHSDLARIQQLADDPEAIEAIERRTKNRRR